MTGFLRLEKHNQLINVDSIVFIQMPVLAEGMHEYRIHMANGRNISITNAEAERLMQLISVYSVLGENKDADDSQGRVDHA